MGFGTGFVTGLASSVDRMLQMDIQRNMDRMSKADTYLASRYEQTQKAELAKKKKKKEIDDKLLEEYAELKELLGDDRRALSAIENKGGTYSALTSALKDFREQSERGIDLNKYFTVAESQNPESLTVDREFLLNRYGYMIEPEAKPTLPEYMRGSTGMMKALFGSNLRGQDDFPEYKSLISDDLTTRVTDDVTIPKGTINYEAGHKAMTFAKQMEDRFTSFDEGYTRLQQQIEAAETPEDRTKLETELANLINLETKIKRMQAKKDGRDTVESVFKDPLKPQNLIKKVYDRATEPYYEVDLENNIRNALEGTEAQTFEALFNAQEDIRATYTTGEGADAFIDPLLDRLLIAEKGRVQGQVNGYIANMKFDFMERQREMPGASNAQVAQSLEKFAIEPDARTVNDKMKQGIYKPGTVIQYEDANGNIKMVVWTGNKPLPGTFDF
tara:strand:+ start:2534 stop:3865 length:1332 start_codon:yes stop_codon:yes gene_type:complete